MHSFLQHIVHRSNKVVTNKLLSRLNGGVFSILLALIAATSISLAQTYTNWTLNGNATNNGTIRVNRNIINNTTGQVTVSGTGVVVLQGNGTTLSHSIQCTNLSNTYPISIIRLDLIGTRPATLNTPTLVPTQLRIGDGTTAYTAASPGFTISSQTLTIGGTSTYMATSTAAITFSGGTVLFNGTTAQSILNNAAGVTYGTLSLTGAGTKNLTTGGTVTAATLTQAGGSGQLSVTENVDVTGTGSFADIGAISATKKLRLTAAATSGSVTSMNNSSTGTFENASNATVTIATLAGNTGTINQSGASGTISFTNAAASNGTITNSSTGTITFANNLTGTGTISQTTNGTINVGGSFTQNTYTLTGGTVVYNGTAAQSVIGTTYNNLTISTTSGNATASAAITLTGNLIINSSSTLDMSGYSTSSFPGGSNNNAGTIRWSGDNKYVAGAGTTEFYGASTGNVAAGANYGILLFSGSGMKTFAASPVTANGNMTVNSGASVTVSGITIQINGNVSLIGSMTNNGTISIGN
jgi:fibronectin-binding autotransporter adhesin